MSFDLTIKEGDLAIGNNGDLQKIEDTDKLIQDLLKIATTPVGSNQFHPFYGSPITRSLIGLNFEADLTLNVATDQLANSISTLQKLQFEQANFQRVTPFEQIAAIQGVEIRRNQVDPRFFHIIIRVVTRALSIASAQLVVNSL